MCFIKLCPANGNKEQAAQGETILQPDLNDDLWLFHTAFRALTKLPDDELAKHGLSRIHNRILFVIGRGEGIAVGAIADKLEISRQALHGPMRQLRTAGLIASEPSPDNRTVQLVYLTEKGQNLEHRINEVQRQHLQLAFTSAGQRGASGWKDVMQAISETGPAAATEAPYTD